MNAIAKDQDSPEYQRLLKARQKTYADATSLQVTQLVMTVLLPVAGAVLGTLYAPARSYVALYGLISRMRVASLPRTVACAEKVVDATIGTYFAPNRTIRELHEMAKSGTGIDPLKDFSEVARNELQAFTSR